MGAAADSLVLLMPVVAAMVLLVLANQGVLSAQPLEASPRRDCGLEGIDLLVGIMLFAGASVLLGPVLQTLGLSSGSGAGGGGGAASGGGTPGRVAMLSLLGQVLVQGPLAVYTLVRVSRQRQGLVELGLQPRSLHGHVMSAFLAFIVAMILVNASNLLFVLVGQLLGYPAPSTGHQLLPLFRQASPLALLGLLLSAVVVAPLLEELIFRGLMQTALLAMLGPTRRWSVIVLASLLFTSVHGSMPWQVMPGLFTLSCILGWLYERSGSLWPGILLHAAFNGANVAIVMLMP